MKYFGVWFHGNQRSVAQIAYQGRVPAIFQSKSEAYSCLYDLEDFNPAEKYSIFEFEIKD